MTPPGKLRVMLCDDSLVVRGALSRILESDPSISVVARVGDGQAALKAMETSPPAERPQVILLDLEMPVMDGMTALPLLLKRDPRPVVIVASALTQRGAASTMAAMRAGAADYIPKPTSTSGSGGGMADPAFRAELLAKVKGWARMAGRAPAASAPPRRPAGPVLKAAPRLIAIGSSTGGPQALAAFVRRLPRRLPVPVVVVQHMPAGFTAMLAQHLDALGGPRCKEAAEGDVLQAGQLYIAPGDRHMLIRKTPSGAHVVALNTDAPENFCRPAVDPMLRSLAPLYGREMVAVILTGMGQDGLLGCQAVARAGGSILAQDEASSVVWGMPGAVSKAGLPSLQAPPEALADQILSSLKVPA